MDKPVRVEVYYNAPSCYGTSYSTGSTRMALADVGQWLQEQLSADKPVLITAMKVLS